MATDWRAKVKGKIKTPQEALALVRPGYRVFIGSACGTPQSLVQALAESDVEDVEIVHILTLGVAPYTREALSKRFRTNAFFISENTREAVQSGRADYTPIFLSEIPRLIRSGRMPLDVALVQVSPPDASGFCSFGISVDVTKPSAEAARFVIAEVNPRMPRTLGDSFIHINQIDAIVENDAPLYEFIPPGESPEARRIAKNVADLVEDGSTIQVGYGGIPSALLRYLKDSRNLGVHTEVFGDSIIDLIESGVIDNSKKSLHPHKVVASFAMGSQRLYDYVDNNPMFEFRPCDYTNDPFVISQNDKMVSINSALEVDLTGQVCADSMGTRFYSGIGGHLDFTRGAARSAGGKPIIVLKSTRHGEEASRIVPTLSEGAGVVTTRGDVHWVVTEWGAAYLHGKTIRERALAMISIAHPKFRQKLLEEAKKRQYIRLDESELSLIEARYPEELESRATLGDGTVVSIRPVKPTDELAVRKFFYANNKDITFFGPFAFLNENDPDKAKRFIDIDYDARMALVAHSRIDGEEKLLAMAWYAVDRPSGMAQASILVSENDFGRGLGRALANQLIRVAKVRGLKGFQVNVVDTNTRAYRLMANCGYPVKADWEDGVYTLTMRFDDES